MPGTDYNNIIGIFKKIHNHLKYYIYGLWVKIDIDTELCFVVDSATP